MRCKALPTFRRFILRPPVSISKPLTQKFVIQYRTAHCNGLEPSIDQVQVSFPPTAATGPGLSVSIRYEVRTDLVLSFGMVAPSNNGLRPFFRKVQQPEGPGHMSQTNTEFSREVGCGANLAFIGLPWLFLG